MLEWVYDINQIAKGESAVTKETKRVIFDGIRRGRCEC